MRIAIKKLLFLLLPVFAKAQDTVVTITPSLFDKNGYQSFIAGMNGWLFKAGTDIAWAKKDIDTRGWKKLKPTQLSTAYADKNGRVECWFRIKIKPDSTLNNFPLSIKISTWAASDLYIDGKLVISCGNTGYNGFAYREHRPYGNPSFPVDLKPANVYTIALHFVDYVTPLPPYELKSATSGLDLLIRITGTGYNAAFIQNGIKEPTVYSTLWISVCSILSLLFWLLYLQNRFEKNLRLIALSSTFLTCTIFCNTSASNNIGLSFAGFMLYEYGANIFLTLCCIIMPIMLVAIFKRKFTAALKAFLLVYFICSVVNLFLDSDIGDPLATILLASIFAISIYYVVSSWKNLKGAQWAIVAGLLCSLFFGLFYVFTNVLFNQESVFLYYLSITGYALSFPLSLLVYVSMRFKEIIKEVQQNAQQVVQLSEEKKEHALNQQKILQEEVNRQTAAIRTTLDNLKATQSQLVQSEKMASLGELTAGIAHEIQNPLNFVNNFSEVSVELIKEMADEVDKGNTAEAKLIASDLIQNLEKISHHGKRADAIVKGMLQHSQTSSATKEPTDINKLADEYLRLAYHGLRAKDKSFNATLKTDYDKTIGNIHIIPQDIGRVILNLIANAFYATAEKKKTRPHYEPLVTVSTKGTPPFEGSRGEVKIIVKDNGNGISKKILEKIFQPFFTTKPTGQGTGLGLSLAYDIIKAHGGELKAETIEGEGSKFSISLPA